jgi:hypothetical protein
MVRFISLPKECVALPQPDDGLVYPLRELVRHAGRVDGVEDRQDGCFNVDQDFVSFILTFLNGVATPGSAGGGPANSSRFILVSALSLPSGSAERLSPVANTGASACTSDASNCATVDQSPAAAVLSKCSSENPNSSQDGDVDVQADPLQIQPGCRQTCQAQHHPGAAGSETFLLNLAAVAADHCVA